MSLLEVSELSIRYGGQAVVDSLSFSLERGEALGLVGESGSGKTQTALALLGLLPPSAAVSGRIRFDGEDIVGRDEAALDALRATRIAMVFQDPALALNPYLRVGTQLARILLRHGLAEGAAVRQRVADSLEAVGLPDPVRQSRAYPHELSGGMRQRVMIAAALIARPALLVADEPTTALDVTVQAQILELLETLRQDTALLLITHDLGIVAGHCQRLLVIENGRCVESGRTRAVFAAPAHEHTQRLLAAMPRLDREPGLTPAGETVLTIDRLSVSYRAPGRKRLRAVKSVDLRLKDRETLAIVGESGSGKSSLVRSALGLVRADDGHVAFLDESLDPRLAKRSRQNRRDLQMVFQDPVGSLNPQMTVAETVAEPLLVHAPGHSRRERQARVSRLLGDVGLDEHYADRYPHELSGGQAQRVAIARALILSPRVLVCDEAVAALDGSVRRQILALLRDIQARDGLSILFIAHDLGVVREISHRVAVMYLGEVVELADNRRLFTDPQHPYTRALIEAVPQVDPGAGAVRAPLHGEIPSPLEPPPGCPFHPRCPIVIEACRTTKPELEEHRGAQVACLRAAEIVTAEEA